MANVIFYSTGEIFWVTDAPAGRKEHIAVSTVFPPVPPDEFFTYAMAADCLRRGGHNIIGAYGRQRRPVRTAFAEDPNFAGDPQFLALEALHDPAHTVLVLIATETGTPDEGGVDLYPRIPFTPQEIRAFATFRKAGGGVYVTWDHGQLGYESLRQLDLHAPIEPEPSEPLRPNTAHSNDSTDSAKLTVKGRRLTAEGPVEADLALSSGPPAGYLQKIIPAQLIYRNEAGAPAPQTPHPVFNGVGSTDGIWIPAHMHEGKLKADIAMMRLDERRMPKGVHTLAVHVSLNETSFNSFAVMAIAEPRYSYDCNDHVQYEAGRPVVESGAVLWDTSFHHLVDINWVHDGHVPWEAFVPFSAESLWQSQFQPDVFQRRLEEGMGRLLVNLVSWLGSELALSPMHQAAQRRGTAADTEACEELRYARVQQGWAPRVEDIPQYR